MQKELQSWSKELANFETALSTSKATQATLEQDLRGVQLQLHECQQRLAASQRSEQETRAKLDQLTRPNMDLRFPVRSPNLGSIHMELSTNSGSVYGIVTSPFLTPREHNMHQPQQQHHMHQQHQQLQQLQ